MSQEKKDIAKESTKSVENTQNFKAKRDKDREKVKGIFRFYEAPGSTLSFSYGPMYKGDVTHNFCLTDGEVAEVPLGVARHLNTNGWYPEYEYVKNEQGVQNVGNGMRIGTKKRRFGFQSLEFTDIEGLSQNPQSSEIVTVERI